MTITPSPARSGAPRANSLEVAKRASTPARANMAAPSSAACQLVPVPTSHSALAGCEPLGRARQLESGEAAQLVRLGSDGGFELGQGVSR